MANTVCWQGTTLEGLVLHHLAAKKTSTRGCALRCSSVCPAIATGHRLWLKAGPHRLTRTSDLQHLFQTQQSMRRTGVARAAASPRAELKTYEEAPPKDGQSRFYMNPMCPYAQRSWVGVKYKGLDNELESVEVDLRKMPQWYKDLYPVGKVPSIEHNGKVTGESLDVLKYLDTHFDGPKLEPASKEDRVTVQKLVEFCDRELVPLGFGTASMKDAAPHEYKKGIKPVLDVLERQLEAAEAAGKGPYLVGGFSTADAAILPFLWRFQFIFENFRGLDLFEDHPRLAKYFQIVSEQPFFAETKPAHERMHATYKTFLDMDYFGKIGLARKPTAAAAS
ncbi:glutathione transferase [Klebsormidium nitens]|uniref:Glutathione transferase n=1 Tax=Klebsormidium nitens TaxID=105231 RepID=A0A1Y1HTM6_KLENI|nr:glutathione transferase [Klebsormidium nitens]|eukprot:GAQ79876.1 glutathione transferase [Klebsormidium nitens]